MPPIVLPVKHREIHIEILFFAEIKSENEISNVMKTEETEVIVVIREKSDEDLINRTTYCSIYYF